MQNTIGMQRVMRALWTAADYTTEHYLPEVRWVALSDIGNSKSRREILGRDVWRQNMIFSIVYLRYSILSWESICMSPEIEVLLRRGASLCELFISPSSWARVNQHPRNPYQLPSAWTNSPATPINVRAWRAMFFL